MNTFREDRVNLAVKYNLKTNSTPHKIEHWIALESFGKITLKTKDKQREERKEYRDKKKKLKAGYWELLNEDYFNFLTLEEKEEKFRKLVENRDVLNVSIILLDKKFEELRLKERCVIEKFWQLMGKYKIRAVRKFRELGTIERIESLKRRKKYYKEAKHRIMRLTLSNANKYSSFLTLTFKDVVSQDDGNKELASFFKRLNYFLYGTREMKLRYIAVPEMQKRLSVHYHIILFNIPYIDNEKLAKIWKNGYLKINCVKNPKQCAIYVAKYVGKGFETVEDTIEDLEKGLKKKRYFCSQGLKQSIVEYANASFDDLMEIINDGKNTFVKRFKKKCVVGFEYKNGLIEKPRFLEFDFLYIVQETERVNERWKRELKEIEQNRKQHKEMVNFVNKVKAYFGAC